MEIRKLSLTEMKSLYTERMKQDFPPDELRPFHSIARLTDAGAYTSFGCFEEGPAAYATFATAAQGTAVLLDYFAVDASRRGQGIGSRSLARLGEKMRGGSASFFMIEVESLESAKTPEQTEERTRRIRFYEGCGCVATGVYSWLFGVEYRILIFPLTGTLPSDDTVQAALEQVYHTIVPSVAGSDPAAFSRVCRCFRR